MGSIQSLRSWALASRANEDTDLQTSGFLGGVNKSLGGQIVGIIDQLQGVIAQRTKAYNGLVSSINKTIDGKDGVAAKAIMITFTAIKNLATLAALLIRGGTITAAAIISLVGGVIANYLSGLGVESTIESAVYDYEKMASQLGYMEVDVTPPSTAAVPIPLNFKSVNLTTGASKFLDLRDALMPKYNRFDDFNVGGANGIYGPYTLKGYVGSLRRD